MIDPAYIPAMTFHSYWAVFDAARLRAVYKWLEQRFAELDVTPQKVLTSGPHYNGKLTDYARTRRRIDASDFGYYWSIELIHQKPDWQDDQERWVSGARISRHPAAEGFWSVRWSVVPSEMGLDEEAAVRHLLDLARLTVDRYGYMYRNPRGYGPVQISRIVRSELAALVQDEEANDTAWWDQDGYPNQKNALLRDVYPINLLTGRYLDHHVQGKTLERWVAADEARGTLQPLNDRITMWRPPDEKIPEIREALFRAGLIAYHPFYEPWSPWYRDFTKPFIPREPIPEVFRADSYRGRDRRLIR